MAANVPGAKPNALSLASASCRATVALFRASAAASQGPAPTTCSMRGGSGSGSGVSIALREVRLLCGERRAGSVVATTSLPSIAGGRTSCSCPLGAALANPTRERLAFWPRFRHRPTESTARISKGFARDRSKNGWRGEREGVRLGTPRHHPVHRQGHDATQVRAWAGGELGPGATRTAARLTRRSTAPGGPAAGRRAPGGSSGRSPVGVAPLGRAGGGRAANDSNDR